jgi:hypothetical protein
MRGVAALAAVVVKHRRPVPHDHPLLKQERAASEHLSEVIARLTDYRDAVGDGVFELLYGH